MAAAAPGQAPANPFAPKAEPVRKSRLSLRRGTDTPGEPPASGKRVAEGPARTMPKVRIPGGLGKRNIAALTVAGVSVVAVIALVAVSALWWLNSKGQEAAGKENPDRSASPGPVLGPAQMLSPAMAAPIDPGRQWTQERDFEGLTDTTPNIPCVGPQAAGQPVPQITHLRVLRGSGNDKTAALHRADAYANPEEARKVFAFRQAELGSCTDTPFYIEKGLEVKGLGDEAVGVRLILSEQKPEYHSVLLVRTGRIVNLLDVAREGSSVEMTAQLQALAQSVNRQCGPAIGLCTAPTTTVTPSLPPAGGDQSGFLAAGDIPRVTPGSGSWRGNQVASKLDIQDGTGCEAVDFNTVGGNAATRQQRTYLLRNDGAAPQQFGVDEVVITMESPEAAAKMVDQVSGSIKGCGTRTLTSQMAKEAGFQTPGAGGLEVKGNWFIVTVKTDPPQKYRVGIASVGNKLIYLRSNPTDKFDFTDEAWASVNRRAGERVSQGK